MYSLQAASLQYSWPEDVTSEEGYHGDSSNSSGGSPVKADGLEPSGKTCTVHSFHSKEFRKIKHTPTHAHLPHPLSQLCTLLEHLYLTWLFPPCMCTTNRLLSSTLQFFSTVYKALMHTLRLLLRNVCEVMWLVKACWTLSPSLLNTRSKLDKLNKLWPWLLRLSKKRKKNARNAC